MSSNGLDRIPSNGGNHHPPRRPYRTGDEGIREWNPRPKPQGVIVLTERVSPSIRTTVGWLYPLEHYDRKLSLDPLSQYAELLLLMGSGGDADPASVHDILREARNRLTDAEYIRLKGYVELFLVGRSGPSPPSRRFGSSGGQVQEAKQALPALRGDHAFREPTRQEPVRPEYPDRD